MKVIIELSFYSPRWGHNDLYRVHFTDTEIYVSAGSKEAKCLQKQDDTLNWTGHNQGTGNPLLNILNDDHIYPPSQFLNGLISAWKSWRTTELTDDELEVELNQLVNWVNESSRSKPKSDYWTGLF